MTNIQRTGGIAFLVSSVVSFSLVGCSSSSKPKQPPGSGGKAGTDAPQAGDGALQDTRGPEAGGAGATADVMGHGGATGGQQGSGGATGTGGGTTTCPSMPNCNWCSGQSQLDSQGCVTGWRCANGIDPCKVSPCTASSPCGSGEICGEDHLCRPAGAGGTGGKGGGTGMGGAGGKGTGGGGAGGTGGSTVTPVRVCGSNAGVKCQSGEFCEYSAEDCTASDTYGVCSKIPAGCPSLYQPVCGCDGKTYDNDCLRQMAYASKSTDGACGSSTGRDAGVGSSLSISPASVRFSSGIGLTSDPAVVVVMNDGPGSSGEFKLSMTGANPNQFIVSNSTCVAFLPAQQSCQTTVAFKAPSTSGPYTAALVFKESGGVQLTVELAGYAFPPPGGDDGGLRDAASATD